MVYYMRDVQLKNKLKYTKKVEVVFIWLLLLHRDRYVSQYYSERYNRNIQVHNLEN